MSFVDLIARIGSDPLLDAKGAEGLNRDSSSLTRRERVAEAAVGGAFAVVAIAILVLSRGNIAIDPATALLAAFALAAASRVRFMIGGHYTVPIMLVFVPVMFVVPLALVPAFTAASLALGALPDVLRRTASPTRLLLAPANAWFSVGPVVVLMAAGAPALEAAAPWLLGAMLAAQFAADFAASAIREAIVGDAPSFPQQLQEVGWVFAVDAGFASVGLLAGYAVHHQEWAIGLLLPLLLLLSVFAAERRARLENLVELNRAYRGTALVLGDVVEADDAYTGEHCRGVVETALELADVLGLDTAQRQRVEFGALLHDVGKIAIPKEIINKPGPLDDREWEIVRTHTVEGHRLLDKVGGLMREVGLIVRAHHERWDGAGYPDGLAGEAIPIEARIVSACDTWNAMVTTRPYRVAMSHADALAEMRACAGTQLDPTVVAHLVALVDPSPVAQDASVRAPAVPVDIAQAQVAAGREPHPG